MEMERMRNAFLDDVHVICKPTRMQEVFQLFETELQNRGGINIHFGKTTLWNVGGIEPANATNARSEATKDCHNPAKIQKMGHPDNIPEKFKARPIA